MTVALEIRHLAKRYRVGVDYSRPGDFRELLVSKLSSPFNKLHRQSTKVSPNSDFWALKDISFSIDQGQAVGVIGKNGAGKSTLLKLLCRITTPTRGEILYRGRMAGLLEVGTGFHPDLTGRENIYLNGAILGMKRYEIQAKLDRIVAFAEVEEFLDTPVKRYSSGMVVRLAFSVSVHVEPDILIVDEVLAVGDLAFQRKCLQIMRDMVDGGTTILFVSHSMDTVQSLTNQCLYLDQGELKYFGNTATAIDRYIAANRADASIESTSTGDASIEEVNFRLLSEARENTVVEMEIRCTMRRDCAGFRVDFSMENERGVLVVHHHAIPESGVNASEGDEIGFHFRVPLGPVAHGEYFVTFFGYADAARKLFETRKIDAFTIPLPLDQFGVLSGNFRPALNSPVECHVKTGNASSTGSSLRVSR